MATPTVGKFFVVENNKCRGAYLTVERHGTLNNGYVLYAQSNPNLPEAIWQVQPNGKLGSACDSAYVLSNDGTKWACVEVDTSAKDASQKMTFRSRADGSYLFQLGNSKAYLSLTTAQSDCDWRTSTAATSDWRFVAANDITDRDKDIPHGNGGNHNPPTGGTPFVPLSETPVKCKDGGDDFLIGANTNNEEPVNIAGTYDKDGAPRNVRAFVHCFWASALHASERCNGLDPMFIIAHWGKESGWGKNGISVRIQNWGNFSGDTTFDMGNIGMDSGVHKFAIFEGITSFARGYAIYMSMKSSQAPVRAYLAECAKNKIKPSATKCANLVSQSDYLGDGGNKNDYERVINNCIKLATRAYNN